MSKEISLSDLGSFSKKSDITPIKTEETISSAPKTNTKEVSVDEIAKTLPGKEKEEIKTYFDDLEKIWKDYGVYE